MSWLSWLPTLPSGDFPLPSNIQRRFVSFALKRSLGHFLKPGQLDVDQIDSQIGSGFVQINNIQLDPQAINALIANLPVELDQGSIGSVNVRIPWPNPLTAASGLSIESLTLVFRISPRSSELVDLAQSVNLAAESFLHDELSPGEEASLRDSFHGGDYEPLPGGLDPFLTDVEIDPSEEREDPPTGVSIFASLVERLLVNFQLEATNVRFELVAPGRASLALLIPRFAYAASQDRAGEESRGLSAFFTVEGLQILLRDLHFSATSSFGSTSQRSDSPASSSSSMDEDAQFSMSQSLTTLPRQLRSPASSMYESAVSFMPTDEVQLETIIEESPTNLVSADKAEECILSLGAEAAEFQITLPLDQVSGLEKYNLSCKLGGVVCALQPWHLVCLAEIVATLPSSGPSLKTSSARAPPSPSSQSISIATSIRSLTLLVLPSAIRPNSVDQSALNSWLARPSKAPLLSINYLKLRTEAYKLNCTFSLLRGVDNAQFSMKDLHVAALRWETVDGERHLCAVPIVITDPELPFQYDTEDKAPSMDTYRCLPEFNFVDVLQNPSDHSTYKISSWRFKSRKGLRADAKESVLSQAFSIQYDIRDRKEPSLRVEISPLHFFLDPHLLNEVKQVSDFLTEVSMVLETSGRSTPRGPSRSNASGKDKLTQAVLADLDLTLDYLSPESPSSVVPSKVANKSTISVLASVNMIRLEIRTTSSPRRSDGTGIFLVDIHGARLGLGPLSSTPFNHSFSSPGDIHELCPFAGFERAVCALRPAGSQVATALLLVGPLSSDVESAYQSPTLSLPESTDGKTRVHGTVPSVYVHLTKTLLDSLQYFADELSQSFSQSSPVGDLSDTGPSPEILGSRFFAQSRSTVNSTQTATPDSGVQFRVTIVEALIRFDVPRTDGNLTSRPLDIVLSDTDLSVESKRSDKLLLSVSIMDVLLVNVSQSGARDTLVYLTSPRSPQSIPTPLLSLLFCSSVISQTTKKESKIDLVLSGFTVAVQPDPIFMADIAAFLKGPPGVFETVEPTERTLISCQIRDGSVQILTPNKGSSVVLYSKDLCLSTAIVIDSERAILAVGSGLSVLVIDDISVAESLVRSVATMKESQKWLALGYALVADAARLTMTLKSLDEGHSDVRFFMDELILQLHICADTASALASFATALSDAFRPPQSDSVFPQPTSNTPPQTSLSKSGLLSAMDSSAFKQAPDVGSSADMINDDLPTNMDYIDESFGTAAGLRELSDDDMEEFDVQSGPLGEPFVPSVQAGISSRVGGETVKILRPEGLEIVNDYFTNIPPDEVNGPSELGETAFRFRMDNSDVTVYLYDGYDWVQTRNTIEEEARDVRRKLAKIKQLLAAGQLGEPLPEDTSSLLFNSVHIGLDESLNFDDRTELMAALDEELEDDVETATQSSWQSLPPSARPSQRIKSTKIDGKRLTRSRSSRIEFNFSGIHLEFDQYQPEQPAVTRMFAAVKDLEILDHIKESTWKKFLTDLYADSRGNVRETGSNMVQLELITVLPVKGQPSEEARLRAKILPLRLYVDQLALDFLKGFFSFQKDTDSPPSSTQVPSNPGIYFQLAEVFPIDLKLDYKPRHVDYRALKEGRTIELMNFFHFDGAEMTLRHIVLAGISGWPRLFDLLNDLWTPDVKATQLVDVISGVAPIRSVVNVGSGVADLVLLPISQYKKDGRIVRGVQKGATAFVRSTAIEAIRLGAQLATGTQVILEQAEGVLGGQFKEPILTEALQPTSPTLAMENLLDDEDDTELISKYADQPVDVREGLQTAYQSLRRNFNSAAQTILAVPMEMHERSGSEGPVRSVIRAVPIAVLKPMIGATEAVSKTLLGLHNTLDPNVRHETDAKYKHRT